MVDLDSVGHMSKIFLYCCLGYSKIDLKDILSKIVKGIIIAPNVIISMNSLLETKRIKKKSLI